MSNICKNVILRKRLIKNGTQYSYYLDYYPGYRDPQTMKVQRHESLGIYIFAKPSNQRERDFNERMTEKAKALRCRRYESIVNERYDFFDKEKMKGDFLEYFRSTSTKHSGYWRDVYLHFEKFVNGKCRFDEITVDLCNRFREYLLNAKQLLHKDQPLHINTVSRYWSTFRAVLHTAYRDHKILENPNGYLERIEGIPTEKEYLSQEELIRLAETPCPLEVLKTAFLFACLTGLRKSDLKPLKWDNIQPYGSGGLYITVRMQKTQEIVHNPISREALDLIDYYEGDHDPKDLVFPGLATKNTDDPLKKWLKAAGITKHITFHCSRHTFATLQVEAGTSVYVVQHFLGHKSVETTQIYARMSDEQKRESVDRITLKDKTKMHVV